MGLALGAGAANAWADDDPGASGDADLERDVATAVLTSGGLEAALGSVLELVCRHNDWQVGQAWVLGMDGPAMYCSPAWYARDGGFDGFRRATLELSPLRDGIPRVLRGAPLDAQVLELESLAGFRRRDAARRARLRTGVFVPLRVDSQLPTVVELFTTERVVQSSRAVSETASALRRVALALERLRLEDQRHVLGDAMQQATDPCVISTVGPSARITFANEALGRLLGCAAHEVVGRHPAELLGAGLGELERAHLRECLQSGSTFESELHCANEVLHVRCSPVRSRDGACTHVLMTLEDLTEARRRASEREQLRLKVIASAKQWRQTFDAIDSPAVIVNRTGAVRRLNLRAMQLLDQPYSKSLGATMAALGSVEPWHTAGLLLAHVAETGEGASDQVDSSESGRSWDVAVTPLGRFADAVGMLEDRFLVLAQDITHIVELERSLRRSEKLAAMGEIVAGVAHEVRNPLFGLSATLDAFESRFGKDTQHAPYLRVLRSTVNRMAHLMQDLLDYGRPASLDLELGQLGPVLAAATDDCRGLAVERGISLSTRFEPGLPYIVLDSSRLRRALSNVLQNAIQHSPPDSSVLLAAERSACGQWVTCTVTDSGPGFAVQDLPHVFAPFFTRRPGGTGLGMAIVQRVLEQHGGHVLAQNAATGGAMVTLRLPIREMSGE